MTATATVLVGDCLDLMPGMEPDSVDAIVTDPPYGLGFMGKAWDHGVPGVPFWVEALRLAKPGAHLLAFGGTRTFHRLTCAIEDAGWEIRDCLSWLYGSGFPKSYNGAWGGTALKPAWEPIILARKPLVGTVAANVQQHGTGALNIDGCRIEPSQNEPDSGAMYYRNRGLPMPENRQNFFGGKDGVVTGAPMPGGRWPANVVLDEDAAAALDEQSGELSSSNLNPGHRRGSGVTSYDGGGGIISRHYGGDSGGASRFFYTAKASRSEREAMEGHVPDKRFLATMNDGIGAREHNPKHPTAHARNHHPTVKPLDLMRWLVRLVTPPNGLILDPFAGSGTTGCAALAEGFRFIGIEREPEYAAIAEARLNATQPALGLGA